MSIIQEALKKAQTTYSEEIAKTEPLRRPDMNAEAVVQKPLAQKTRRAATPLKKLIPGIVLLALIAGFGLNSFFSKNPAEPPKDKSHQSVSYKPAAANSGLGIQAQDITSPIKSVISSGAAFVHAPDFVLNGIMYLQERPRAIINGNMVEVGESISGAKVDAITKNSVSLNYNDLEITLKLKE